ncbi:AraC family transcriptional regulator [Paenibacillus nasutitermitis]|uniref:HTH-type transcriptional regulator YtdP n=1 Tax=Paenibacillus nasutitermitis TaxID=1652958 RepID=A0A916Z6E8_9BACL|nr:AraC family transcriptional regulator [Paenibacillus nasutitermitis]GGD78819.1 putative HTH-type transcriptional regulator YtdP [Paenibacillus nasutitermitis]
MNWEPQKLLRKSAFRKHLILFFLTILIPAVLFLSFNLYRSSNQLRGEMERTSANRLDRIGRNIDSLSDNVSQLSTQLSLTPSINDLLKRPYDLSIYDYSVIKEQLRGWTTSNSIFHSLALHVYQNDKILTTSEGLYNTSDYYDSAFITGLREEAKERHSSWTGIRTVKGSAGTPDEEMLTFARSVPATLQTPLGMLIIDIQKDSFMQAILNFPEGTAEPTVVLDPWGKLVSGSIDGLDTEGLVRQLKLGELRTDVMTAAGGPYFVTARKGEVYGWTLLQLTPYGDYSAQMKKAASQALFILFLILLAGLGVSYLFASILYDPWKRMAERLKEFVIRPFDTGKIDAFNLVDDAIGHLITTVRQNEPIIRDHLVQELLHNRLPGDHDVLEQFAQTGLRFKHKNFLVLLLVAQTNSREDEQGSSVYLYSLAEDMLTSQFPVAGSILDRGMFGFILNVNTPELQPADQESLERCCRQIQEETQGRWSVWLHVVVGGIRSVEKVHEAYELARRAVTYKAFLASSDLVYADGTREELQFDYPASYQKLFLNTILAGDKQAAEELVTQLFEKYIHQNRYALPKLQQMFVMLMSHMLGSLVQEGYDIGELMDEVSLLNLQKYRDSSELQSYIRSTIGLMMDYVHEVRNERSSPPYIREAMLYMEQHYERNIAISDVAEVVGISSGHLGRLFKAETGKPPLEYLTEYRLQQGKKLLLDASRSLQTISEAIGYNDVHTFIRYFKKYEGITPGEYRKKIM